MTAFILTEPELLALKLARQRLFRVNPGIWRGLGSQAFTNRTVQRLKRLGLVSDATGPLDLKPALAVTDDGELLLRIAQRRYLPPLAKPARGGLGRGPSP